MILLHKYLFTSLALSRFDVLVMFNRVEIHYGSPLRASLTSMVLTRVSHVTYLHSLERFMSDNEMFPDDFERALFVRWMWSEQFGAELPPDPSKKSMLDVLTAKKPHVHGLELRLFVVTAKAIYVLKPPSGTVCGACDASKFCPKGPVLVGRLEMSHVKSMTCSAAGHRASFVYTKPDVDRGTVVKKKCVLSSHNVDTLPHMMKVIQKVHPDRFGPPIEKEKFFDEAVFREMKVEREKTKIRSAKAKKSDEEFVGFVACRHVVVSGEKTVAELEESETTKKMKPAITLVSTSKVYIMYEQQDRWMKDHMRLLVEEVQEDMRREAELRNAANAATMALDKDAEDTVNFAASFKKVSASNAQVPYLDHLETESTPTGIDQGISLGHIDKVQFEHSTQPFVSMRTHQATTLLHFADDTARETFKRHLAKAMDLSHYKRAFTQPTRNEE